MSMKRVFATLLCAVMVLSNVASLDVRAMENNPEESVIELTSEESVEDILAAEPEEDKEAGEVGGIEGKEEPEETEDLEIPEESEILPEEGDGDDVLQVADGAKYNFSISAANDGTVNAGNINLSWSFKQDAAGLGNGSISIHPGTENDEHRYSNTTGEQNVPVQTSQEVTTKPTSLILTVQTAGPQNIISTTIGDNNYIRLTKGESTLENYLTSDILADARKDNGDYEFTIDISDTTITSIDINLYIIANPDQSSGGGGNNPDPNQHTPSEKGKFQVRVSNGKGIPENTTPAISLKFEGEANATTYTSSNELSWNDIPEGATKVTIDVSAYKDYFQNIQLFQHNWDDENYKGSTELPDVFDNIRNNEYSYEISIDPAAHSYTFAVVFSYTRSVSWSYKEADKDRDNYVEHCKIYLLDRDGNQKEYVDEAYEPDDGHYATTDYVNYQLTIGQNYQFKLVPDKGYQIAGLQINSYTVTADADRTGVFNFTMQDFNFHINGIVEEVGNIEKINSSRVDDIIVHKPQEAEADALDEKFDEDMGGSMMFTVDDKTETSNDYKDSKNYKTAADCTDVIKAMTAESTIDIGIEQVVAKDKVSDTVDYWEKPITELTSQVDVELEYAGEAGATYKVARKHGDKGEIEILDATYEAGVLKFSTDKFSEYTILKSSNKKTTKVEIDCKATTDYPAGFFVKAFDASARVGSQIYDVITENNKYYVEVPQGDTVAVSFASINGLDKVVSADLVDSSKNSGKTVKPSTAGEYTIETKDLDTATLTLNIEPLEVVKIMNGADSEALVPVKGVYNINHNDSFTAYVIKGSKLSESNVVANVLTDAKFYNGTTEISAADNITITNGKLKTTGTALDCAGKTITLKIESAGKSYSAKIKFNAPATTVKVQGEKIEDGVAKLSLPYDTDKTYSVTFSAGTDTSAIKAYYLNASGEKTNQEINFGTFDGKALKVESTKVVDNISLGDTKNFAFFEGTTKIANKNYSITFTNQFVNKVPVVKANNNLTTNQSLGLTITLPSGTKPTSHLFYVVKCKMLAGQENYYTNESNTKVYVYETEVQKNIPVTEKNVSIAVNRADFTDKETGWPLEYEVTVKLCYYKTDNSPVDATGVSDKVNITTKTNVYETSLKLTKKAPSKIYTGQMNVPLAIPKWQNATTVRGIEEVRLYNSDSVLVGMWNRWADASNNILLKMDSSTETIKLDTVKTFTNEGGDQVFSLTPGKYTLTAKAIGGMGKNASASITFNLAQGIDELELTTPNRINKVYNKAASFKATVSYNPNMTPAATKKVTWSILKDVQFDNNGDLIKEETFENGDPLFGMVTVKNGTITINKNFKVGSNTDNNRLIVKAQAADYAENTVTYWSDPIEVTSIIYIPTTIRLRWGDKDNGYAYSDVTEDNIKNNKKFLTSSVNNAEVVVLDQFGSTMEAALSVSKDNLMLDSNYLIVKKPGTMTIKATSTDGTKKSKQIKFTTIYTDSTRSYDAIIWDAGFNTLTQTKDSTGTINLVNKYDSLNSLYILVGGVDSKHNSAQIKHSFTVNSGGKKVGTYYDWPDNYVVYEVVPNKAETIITIKDTTAGRTATTYKYKISNSAISNKAAPRITGDKTKIYNNMALDGVAVGNDDSKVLNRVIYTISGATTDYTYAKIEYPDKAYDDSGRVEYKQISGGKFTIDFFEKHTDSQGTYYRTVYEGSKYTFYVTLGTGTGLSFVPKVAAKKMTINLSKPPKPSAWFKTTSFNLMEGAYSATVEAPTIKNGYKLVTYDYNYLASDTIKGVTNRFPELFSYSMSNGDTTLTLNESFTPMEISITSDEVVFVKNRTELEKLRKGEFTADTTGNYSSSGALVSTATKQKSAYSKWAKDNMHGYLKFSIIDYCGNEIELYQKVSFSLVDKTN